MLSRRLQSFLADKGPLDLHVERASAECFLPLGRRPLAAPGLLEMKLQDIGSDEA